MPQTLRDSIQLLCGSILIRFRKFNDFDWRDSGLG